MSSTLPTLTSRVRYLVIVRFGSSVNAAAKASGIPQRTLSRIVHGETKSPNAVALRKFAAASKVSESWLLTGAGKGPRMRRARGTGRAESEWFMLVEGFGLNRPREQLIIDIPDSASVITRLLEPDNISAANLERYEDWLAAHEPAPHVAALLDSVYRAWTEYFRALIAIHGLGHLEDQLRHKDVLATIALGGSYAAREEVANGDNEFAKTALNVFAHYVARGIAFDEQAAKEEDAAKRKARSTTRAKKRPSKR